MRRLLDEYMFTVIFTFCLIASLFVWNSLNTESGRKIECYRMGTTI